MRVRDFGPARRRLFEAERWLGVAEGNWREGFRDDAMRHVVVALREAGRAVVVLARAVGGDDVGVVCLMCGCTDERACDVGCSWVWSQAGLGLCSACWRGDE